MAADSECNSQHISRKEMFPLGTYVMVQLFDDTEETKGFTHGVVTTICSSRGIGVHYLSRSPDGDYWFDFAYWDTNLLQYPNLAAKQNVQVRETLTSTTWRDTQVLKLLGKRALTTEDIKRHKLAWSDRGRLVSAFLVAAEKLYDDGCKRLRWSWAFNVRVLFWKCITTPMLEHCNLFSNVTFGKDPKPPTKRKALPTTAMVPKKTRQPQSNKTLQYMGQAARLMHEISKLFHADATEVHEFIASQTLQAARAARERYFEKSGKMCIFRELAGSKCDCYSIYVPADYRGEQQRTLQVTLFGQTQTNPFFINIIQAALDTCFNSLPSIAEKKKWVARGSAAICADLQAHWEAFGVGMVMVRERVTNLSHPR